MAVRDGGRGTSCEDLDTRGGGNEMKVHDERQRGNVSTGIDMGDADQRRGGGVACASYAGGGDKADPLKQIKKKSYSSVGIRREEVP